MLQKFIENFKKPNYNETVIFIVMAILLLTIFTFGMYFVEGFAKTITWDSSFYLKMSYSPFQSSFAPYMYRLLTPFLVYLLPFDHMVGFKIINLTGLYLTIILFYYYLKKLDFNQIERLIGILFLLFSPVIIYTLYDIVLVDSLSFLFLLLGFYAILCKNDKLYIISLILGVLNKETILFTLPLYFLWKFENENLIKTIKSTLQVIILPLALFIGINCYFGSTGYISIISLKTILCNLISNNILEMPYFAFGTLWIMFIFGIKYIENDFLRKSMYIIPLIFLQLFIATDSFRIVSILFPILIPVSLYIFRVKNNIIISMLLLISIFSLFCYIIALTNSLSRLLFIPFEILIFSMLMIYYMDIKGIYGSLLNNKYFNHVSKALKYN